MQEKKGKAVNLPLTRCVSAVLGLAVVTQPVSGEAPRLGDTAIVVADRAPAKAFAFDLKQVQLLDGAFKRAQELDRENMIQVNMDTLYYPFRREAHLPSPVKGSDGLGWPVTGHMLGHYLSAAAMLWRNTGDEEIRKRADAAVAVLAECQAAHGNGYIGGFPEKSILELEGLVKDPSVHANVPWYCLHKVYAGLLDMTVLAGNRQALDVLEKAAGWIEKNLSQLNDQQMEAMLKTEHGGMKDVLINLYATTGKDAYLKLAERFTHHAVTEPFLQGKDPLDGLHANTQFPKFIGLARQYELIGDASLYKVATAFWNSVANDRSYVTGGNSIGEHFSPKGRLSEFVGKDTSESCNEYNMLKLTQHLFCSDPQAKYADYYERTLLNHILSARHPEDGGQLYFQQLESGRSKGGWAVFAKGGNSCCCGTGLESAAKFADSIYYHDGSNGLFVNLFVPSVLDWTGKGVRVRQETRYPEEGKSQLLFTCQHPQELMIHLRRPWWAISEFRILINGQRQDIASTPGSYAAIQRSWQSGDMLEIVMPMTFRTEGFKDNPKRVALMYGPLVIAAVTEPDNRYSVINSDIPHLLDCLKPLEGRPLEFTAPADVFRTATNDAPGKVISFKPLLNMAREPYVVYWKLLSEAERKAEAGIGPASIKVEVDKPGATVSPLLYGIFFEEINRAGDGGIYAEMLQNRSFEDATVPIGWSVVRGDGEMTLDKAQPLNANNPTSLRLEGRVSVANNGFKGAPYLHGEDPAKWLPAFEKGVQEMPNAVTVKQGQAYQLSLYVRGQGPLTVTLEKQDGTVLAKSEIDGVGAEWKKFDATLTPGATEPNARLVATASNTVWLDMVSLMPQGQMFRGDLLKLLADMKPAFVRFPGGCWVEGDTMRFAYRWKKTLGDVAERPGLWNRWGYYSTDGLGMHEYLLLCEALKAEPLFVINCGMSHKENVPLDKMDEFVQDALDAIEYCNGPADSKWGALRAKAGHPAPFNLKYLEIGNENGGEAYQDRYPLFHDAIKKRYPDMHLILDYVPCKTRPSEIVDEHYYNSPDFFIRNADKYDKYDRAAHKVYVGEYAVTRGSGRGNLKGALGEAAFMTGMERNGDVVVMGSYAPLFEHVGWKHWNPNAILFDAARSYATPSWQVQTLFGRNRADVILPTTVIAPLMDSTEARGGLIGVGTWLTQAEYRDIKVTQGDKVLFEGNKGWKYVSGDWTWDGDVLRQTGTGPDLRAYAGKKEWKDYTLTLKARKLGGAEGFLVSFAATDEKSKSWWNIGGWGNSSSGLEIRDVEAERVPCAIETGRWYDIKVELKGPTIRCSLDGKLIHDVAAAGVKPLYAVAGLAGHDIVLKVVNVADRPEDATIELKGATNLAETATSTVLTGTSGDEENSFEEPVKVSPKDVAIRNIAPNFRHTFPANSVTVLRMGKR